MEGPTELPTRYRSSLLPLSSANRHGQRLSDVLTRTIQPSERSHLLERVVQPVYDRFIQPNKWVCICRTELTIRTPCSAKRHQRLGSTHRLRVGSMEQCEDRDPGRIRHLLRSGADRNRRAEFIHHSAIQQLK